MCKNVQRKKNISIDLRNDNRVNEVPYKNSLGKYRPRKTERYHFRFALSGKEHAAMIVLKFYDRSWCNIKNVRLIILLEKSHKLLFYAAKDLQLRVWRFIWNFDQFTSYYQILFFNIEAMKGNSGNICLIFFSSLYFSFRYNLMKFEKSEAFIILS